MNDADPYRSTTLVARYVCVACHRSLSVLAGRCARCDVERLDLSRPDVRDEVRAYAEDRLQRLWMREQIGLTLVSMAGGSVLSALLLALLGWSRGVDWFVCAAVFFGICVQRACSRLLVRLRPRSAIAVYAARRSRLAMETGADVDMRITEYYDRDKTFVLADPSDAPLVAHVDTQADPEVSALNVVLVALGARVEG